MIKNCTFKNNSIFISTEYQETAGAIYLQSNLVTEIINCLFLVRIKKNKLELF